MGLLEVEANRVSIDSTLKRFLNFIYQRRRLLRENVFQGIFERYLVIFISEFAFLSYQNYGQSNRRDY
jgi:hypothetical protein